MQYLTLKSLLVLHEQIIAASGGSVGVRDYGRLESVIATQRQEVFGRAVYETIFDKAAAITRGIIGDHPFVDGNKRTGTIAALQLLEANDYDMSAISDTELEDFAVSVATDHLDIPVISAWFQTHSAHA